MRSPFVAFGDGDEDLVVLAAGAGDDQRHADRAEHGLDGGHAGVGAGVAALRVRAAQLERDQLGAGVDREGFRPGRRVARAAAAQNSIPWPRWLIHLI